ncbi:MAG: ABC transporter substrate-binding protein [Alphaproteobacteria bacterium]
MFKHVKLFPVTVMLFLITAMSWPVQATAVADPSAFVTTLTQSAFATLRDKHLSEPERFARFRTLLSQGVDLPRVGRFVLGAHWRRADAAQQAEYQSLFSNYIIAAYAGRLKDYTDAKIAVKDATPMDKGEHLVATLITHPKNPEPVHVDWRLREIDGELRVLDMSIQGISMALTQRSEFSSIIQQNGGDINVLLARLRTAAAPIEAGKQVSITK